jgi:hypothetical protein
MLSASNDILIDRACDDVSAFLANPENDPQWRGGVLDLKRASGEGVGTRYAQRVKGLGGRRIAADIEITERTPGKRSPSTPSPGLSGPAGATCSPPPTAERVCASSSRPTCMASGASWLPWCKTR